MKKSCLALLKFFLPLFIYGLASLISCNKTLPLKNTDSPSCFRYETERSKLIITTPQGKEIQEIQIDKKGPVGKPIIRTALYSTTYHPIFKLLNCENRVVAIDNETYSNSEWIHTGIKKGKIITTGSMPNVDIEKLMSAEVDSLFAPPYSISPSMKRKLEEAKIRIFYIQEWEETTPLARSAWIEVFGKLLGCNDQAIKAKKQIENRYQKIRKEINLKKNNSEPLILCSIPWQGKWGIPGGNSYLAKLIYDAGGQIIKDAKKQTGSRIMQPEKVLLLYSKAEIWLINSSEIKTKESLLKTIPLYKFIPAFNLNRLYNNNKRVNQYGGNDYFESSIIYPDQVLCDLAEIISAYFEERKIDENKLFYYTQVQ